MQKFKDGQKVKIVAGSAKRVEYHCFNVGDVGTVEAWEYTNKHGNIYTVDVPGASCTQLLAECQLQAIGPDFTKPVFTAEGTPVQIVTTTGRDPKYPVLGYEGNAKILSKFSLEGKNKNRAARRHLTNEQPKETPVETVKATKEVFVNLYEVGTVRNTKGQDLVPGGIIGNQRYASVEQCNTDYGRVHAADKSALIRCGVAKVTIVAGRMPGAN